MNVTLQDIEHAIRLNFVLDRTGLEFLQTARDADKHDTGTARMVFIACAKERGYTMQDICTYAGIEDTEYNRKTLRYKEMMIAARRKVEDYKRDGARLHLVFDKHDADRDLHLLRKMRLVRNCLNLKLHAKTLEFRKSLPNYAE